MSWKIKYWGGYFLLNIPKHLQMVILNSPTYHKQVLMVEIQKMHKCKQLSLNFQGKDKKGSIPFVNEFLWTE